MAKKAKKAAPVKPERTASRAKKAIDDPTILQIDKLGTVITWNVPTAPYKDEPDLRSAFIGGCRARVGQVNHDSIDGPPLRFSEGSVIQRAFEDGYNEMARQDGRNLKPAALAGSKSRGRKRG